MKNIVTLLQPFILKQTIIVYEDGNKIDALEIETVNIIQGMTSMILKYEIRDITLGGSKSYTKKIGNDLIKFVATQYSIDNLNIKYV